MSTNNALGVGSSYKVRADFLIDGRTLECRRHVRGMIVHSDFSAVKADDTVVTSDPALVKKLLTEADERRCTLTVICSVLECDFARQKWFAFRIDEIVDNQAEIPNVRPVSAVVNEMLTTAIENRFDEHSVLTQLIQEGVDPETEAGRIRFKSRCATIKREWYEKGVVLLMEQMKATREKTIAELQISFNQPSSSPPPAKKTRRKKVNTSK